MLERDLFKRKAGCLGLHKLLVSLSFNHEVRLPILKPALDSCHQNKFGVVSDSDFEFRLALHA